MIDYDSMSVIELKTKLATLKESINEIEEERKYVLGQTGYHIQGGTVKQYESELNIIKTRILEIEELLKRKAQ